MSFSGFSLAPLARYLVPVLPALSLVLCPSAAWLMGKIPIVGARAARSWSLAVVAAAILISPSALWWRDQLRALGPLPQSSAERDAYLARIKPAYPLVQLVNHTVPHARVYGIGVEDMAYFVDGDYFGDWFGPMAFGQLGPDGQTTRFLSSLSIDRVLVSKEHVFSRHIVDNPDFRLVTENGRYALYEPVPSSVKPAPTAGAATDGRTPARPPPEGEVQRPR